VPDFQCRAGDKEGGGKGGEGGVEVCKERAREADGRPQLNERSGGLGFRCTLAAYGRAYLQLPVPEATFAPPRGAMSVLRCYRSGTVF